MNAEIKAKAEAFLMTKKFKFAYSMVCMWLESFFADTRVNTRQRAAVAVDVPAGRASPAALRDPAHPHGVPLPVSPRGVGE